MWVALVGAVLGLAYAAIRRRLGPDPGPWAVAVAVAFLLPFAVSTAAGLEREPPDDFRLSDGLVDALGEASVGVVIAKPETQFQVVANAPVYVVAVPKMHTIDTGKARPFERLADTARFFDPGMTSAERNEILERYGVSWLVLDRRRGYPADFRVSRDPGARLPGRALHPLPDRGFVKVLPRDDVLAARGRRRRAAAAQDGDVPARARHRDARPGALGREADAQDDSLVPAGGDRPRDPEPGAARPPAPGRAECRPTESRVSACTRP